MVGDTTASAGSSSRPRHDDRPSHRHRHRDSTKRHRDDSDDEARTHAGRTSHRDGTQREDRDRHRSRHDRGDDDRHRSSHRRTLKEDRHRVREREGKEEDRSERKRRHRDQARDRSERRHDERREHMRHHHREEGESKHRSRSDKEQHASKDVSLAQPATDLIPTSASLALINDKQTPTDAPPASTLKRDDWMTRGISSREDDAAYFSSLGRARIELPRAEKPDPEKLHVSPRELNTQLREGKTVDEYETPAGGDAAAPQYGAPGYQWRMIKLKRTLEAAEHEGRRLEDVALERYASLDDFEHARAERRFLDGKEQGMAQGGGGGAAAERSTPTLQSVAKRSYLIASGGVGDGDAASTSGADSPSRPSSRQAFKRPGESSQPATPTPAASAPSRPPRNIGFETPSSSKPSTPTTIPSVFTPVVERQPSTADAAQQPPPQGVVLDDGSSDPDRPILSPDQLNKLQAKIMRAELMGDANLDALRAEYERESARATAHHSMAGDRGGGFAASAGIRNGKSAGGSAGVLVQDGERELQVLPTLDARGRMYDVGSLTADPHDAPHAAGAGTKGKRKLKGRDEFEARDPTTGSIVRYSADDDTLTLNDLVRQEKFSAGSRWAKNPDAEVAANIMTDTSYSADLDEQDADAHRYAKRKSRSDALKRQFAIDDFARTRKVLEQCRLCYRDEGAAPPRATVVSAGYRAYLAIPDVESATPSETDHVWIVPAQHHLSLLEADEATWDELRNFQKSLVQLADAQGKAVVFYETVKSVRAQLHSVMEAVFVPKAAMAVLPGVFKQSLGEQGMEFSANAKVIEFTPARPFRGALVPELPYFAVCWDYRWSTGYGHVIETADGGKQDSARGGAYDVDEMSASLNSRNFDPNFARDVIRGVLEDLDDGEGAYERSYGKSRRRSEDEKRAIRIEFENEWRKVDWTKLLVE